jgi:hypothetical protein
MVSRLDDFIEMRLQELSAEEEKILTRLDELRKEREVLIRAQKLSETVSDASTALNPDHKYSKDTDSRKQRVIKPKSIMDEVINILKYHGEGLIALDILFEINKRREHPHKGRSPRWQKQRAACPNSMLYNVEFPASRLPFQPLFFGGEG